MVTLLFKSTLCSAAFLAFYFLFLEKEKMHRFNRFYLLLSILCSGIIPFITFKTSSYFNNIPNLARLTDYNLIPINSDLEPMLSAEPIFDWSKVFMICYLVVSFFLLVRFLINAFKIYNIIKISELGVYKKAKLVFLNNVNIPFSFLNFIFLKKETFENGKIEAEILEHELAHVEQKHTIDILFLELLLIFGWVNPILFLYKKAIQLNHEFLADEGVIKRFNDIISYQKLLLNKSLVVQNINFTSPFNFFITKKRLIMMTKSSSSVVVFIKKMGIIPFLATCIYLFSDQIAAQSNTGIKKSQIKEIPSTNDGVSNALLEEYKAIVNLIDFNAKWNAEKMYAKITSKERNRLETIFLQMKKRQQNEQIIYFEEKFPPLEKYTPKKAEFEKWKDKNMYGVWLDGKRIKNTELNKYKNTDFSLAFVSFVHKNARNFGPHQYQVDLETHQYYENYVKMELADTSKQMLVRYKKFE